MHANMFWQCNFKSKNRNLNGYFLKAISLTALTEM